MSVYPSTSGLFCCWNLDFLLSYGSLSFVALFLYPYDIVILADIFLAKKFLPTHAIDGSVFDMP